MAGGVVVEGGVVDGSMVEVTSEEVLPERSLVLLSDSEGAGVGQIYVRTKKTQAKAMPAKTTPPAIYRMGLFFIALPPLFVLVCAKQEQKLPANIRQAITLKNQTNGTASANKKTRARIEGFNPFTLALFCLIRVIVRWASLWGREAHHG